MADEDVPVSEHSHDCVSVTVKRCLLSGSPSMAGKVRRRRAMTSFL